MSSRTRVVLFWAGLAVVAGSVAAAVLTTGRTIRCDAGGASPGVRRCVVEQVQRLDPYDLWFAATAFLGGAALAAGVLSARRAEPPFPEDLDEDARWENFARG